MDDQEVPRKDIVGGAPMNNLLTVVSDLIETLAEAESADRGLSQERLRQARETLLTYTRLVSRSPHRMAADLRAPSGNCGGLALWQIRSLRTHIEANLDRPLSCEALACSVGLSASHFSRAFKRSFGWPPHRFLMQSRVERAQHLMLKSGAPLAQISVECGLSDQAHLSRIFRRFTGESPASWRRARIGEPEGGLYPVVPGYRGAGIEVCNKISKLR
jgi:AraC family transcriptional regulator